MPITKLSEEHKSQCEGKLNDYECGCALLEMANNKSPGSDGLTVEFFKIFLSTLKEHYIKSINYSFEHCKLTALQKEGFITLIPKSDTNLDYISNWRPISLLNIDYKIATKAIANRIKKGSTTHNKF